jgi:copper transport protein
MHIGAAALWVGGLIQFVVVIVAVRRHVAPSAAALSRLVGYFTNFARVAVAGLILTGFFASWLHVHSFEALVTTTYGGLLMIKLGLFIPLIGLAAYNLFFTQRGLKQGQERWGARLRGSVSAEILLTVSILAVVGAMASTPPAKTVYDARAAAQAAAAPSDPIRETLTVNGVAATLDIAPGYTGSNTFTLTLIDGDEQPVTDASRIRMIFRNLTEGGGDSELRLEHQGDGVYTVIGANISVAGSWRLRTTVAREGEFDRVYDFTPEMTAAPAPPPATRVDLGASMPDRVPILLAVGLLAVAVGGYFLGESRWRIFQGAGFIAVALLIVGIVFLASSLNALPA